MKPTSLRNRMLARIKRRLRAGQVLSSVRTHLDGVWSVTVGTNGRMLFEGYAAVAYRFPVARVDDLPTPELGRLLGSSR